MFIPACSFYFTKRPNKITQNKKEKQVDGKIKEWIEVLIVAIDTKKAHCIELLPLNMMQEIIQKMLLPFQNGRES